MCSLISEFPPHKEVDISIELVPRTTPTSKETYKMSTPELNEVHYLGHVVSREGITLDPEKIRAIMEWAAPRKVEEVRSFIGLEVYYRRLIMNFSWIAYPITSLQRKGKEFEWVEKCEASFEELKQLLTHAPMLKIEDPNKEFVVSTDICKRGLGRVLMQDG
eukprot:PITA_04183